MIVFKGVGDIHGTQMTNKELLASIRMLMGKPSKVDADYENVGMCIGGPMDGEHDYTRAGFVCYSYSMKWEKGENFPQGSPMPPHWLSGRYLYRGYNWVWEAA